MKPQKHIPIYKDLLIWARRRNNMPIDEVANRMNRTAEAIKEWEEGISTPTYNQLEKLAYEVYKIPLAAFFRSTPPQEPKINQKFRALSDTDISSLPYKLMQCVREGQFYQESLKELLGITNIKKDELLKHKPSIAIEEIASLIRNKLGINSFIQSNFTDSRIAFDYYRNRLEDNGIYVFQQTLEKKYRGYSLFDESYPIIIINSSEASVNGKIFTLFHELAHIILGKEGITKSDYLRSENDLERQCNNLASLILIDNISFLDLLTQEHLNQHSENWSNSKLLGISKVFKVSKEVILRRLLELNLTTNSFYNLKHDEWSRLDYTKKSNGGANHYVTKLSQLGRNYSTIVFQNLYNGKISVGDAANYLRTRNNGVLKLENLLYSK